MGDGPGTLCSPQLQHKEGEAVKGKLKMDVGKRVRFVLFMVGCGFLFCLFGGFLMWFSSVPEGTFCKLMTCLLSEE